MSIDTPDPREQAAKGFSWDNKNESENSLEVQYQKSLEAGLDLAKVWNRLGEDDSYEGAERQGDLKRSMDAALRERVALLRAQPGFQTIEDVDPDVKLSLEQRKALEEYGAVEAEGIMLAIKDLHEQKIDRNRLHEVRENMRELRSKTKFDELTEGSGNGLTNLSSSWPEPKVMT